VPAIILPGKLRVQPGFRPAIDPSVLPGRSQVFLPSLGYNGVIYGGQVGSSLVTLQNANAPFTQVKSGGIAHVFRPNTGTISGESYKWQTPNFDIGSNGSMFWYGYLDTIIGPGQESVLEYGGSSWGLLLECTGSQVKASYVDNPTSAAFTATLSASVAANVPIAVGLIKSGTTVTVVCRGSSASTSGGNGGIRRSAGSGFGYEYNPGYAGTFLAGVTSEALSVSAMQALLDAPWSVFRAHSRRIFIPSAGGGATATGDLSQTLGAVTSSSAGTVDVQGALSKTLSTLSLSSTGTVDVQGALSQTLSTLTLSSTGTVDVTGTLAVTLGTLTPSASGTVSSGPIGDLTVTLANVAISSTGTVDVTGALSNTLATLTTAATGTVEVVGSSTNTLGALSISAAGTVGTTVSTGDLSQTLATLTASSTGTVSVSGTLSTTMGNLTLVAYDVEPVSSRPGTIMGGRRVVKEIDALFRAREEQALAALKRADDELLMIIALAA